MYVVLEHKSVIVHALFLSLDVRFYVGYKRLVAVIVGRVAATGPTHGDTFLFVGSGDLKIVVGNAHLFVGSLRLSRAHVALFQELVEWSDEILAKVKIIVIHPRRQDQTSFASTGVMKVLRVLERNE